MSEDSSFYAATAHNLMTGRMKTHWSLITTNDYTFCYVVSIHLIMSPERRQTETHTVKYSSTTQSKSTDQRLWTDRSDAYSMSALSLDSDNWHHLVQSTIRVHGRLIHRLQPCHLQKGPSIPRMKHKIGRGARNFLQEHGCLSHWMYCPRPRLEYVTTGEIGAKSPVRSAPPSRVLITYLPQPNG